MFSSSSSLSKEVVGRDGKPIVSIMITRLAQNVARNQFIARRVVAMRAQGRVILVLSDRIAQLHSLQSMIVDAGVDASEVGLFTGATKNQLVRTEQLAKPVVLCSYGMANEGLDKREADTCVMATPKSRVTQCIGRIQRPCETKKPPLVLDVADDDTSIFTQLRWKRQRLYAKEKYEIQVVQADAASEHDWFA
jgi:superfamily II DNA or RNA helicase